MQIMTTHGRRLLDASVRLSLLVNCLTPYDEGPSPQEAAAWHSALVADPDLQVAFIYAFDDAGMAAAASFLRAVVTVRT